ncbi:15230_t:CDS:2 [Entrophospora sp. SA101]|nr:15709_t:CDS:2 [Entrophospora sp. SA101]CAJ0629657.1 11027_t:CDS:2 [Entrophospora sp. SA101]CAJ0750285.1 7466_t:CDS:2 [Entrophospora sp. SA101]CAJ0759153.1 17547_t:CDS:2 [Entrophospora sp. SA101]CAJ0759156.1 17550_t:CDS:2 [Entrophospora sp. SA101]
MDFQMYNDAERAHIQKSIEQKQVTCVNRCAEKFLKHNDRVGQRWAELNQQMVQQQMEQSSQQNNQSNK